MHRINAVGHFLGLCEAIFIAGQIIALGFFGGVIADSGFQIHRKFGTGFGSFNLRVTVVGVFDDGDAAHLYCFQNIQRGAVQFHGVELGFGPDVMNGTIQQIALGRRNFTDAPIIAADVISGDKLTVGVGGVGVDQLVALIHTVFCACQRGITLGSAGGCIRLGNGSAPLFQDIGEALVGYAVPLNGSGLIIGNNVLGGCIDFLQCITGADQHIGKVRDSITIGNGIFVHGLTAERSAVQMERDTLVQTILGVFINGKVAAFQNIVKGHGCGSSANNGHALGTLGFIFVIALFGDGVNAGGKAVDENLTCRIGFHRLIDTITGHREGNALHNAVLGGLFQRNRAGRRFHIQICHHRICIFHASDHILQAGVTVGNQLGAFADNRNVISGRCDTNRTGKSVVRGNGQRTPGL